MSRTLPEGSIDEVWGRLDSVDDLSAVTVEVCHTADFDVRAAWETPANIARPAPNAVRFSKLVTAARINGEPTTYHVFARVSNDPRKPIIYCGIYKVR